MSLICKVKSKDFDFYIINKKAIDKILKTIIFIYKIKKIIKIANYLCLKFLNH